MGKAAPHQRPSKPCPKCGKKGYRATNLEDGTPIIRCKYCGHWIRR